jgi:hypothetical protein
MSWKITILFAALATALPNAAAQPDTLTPPSVPSNLEVPAGYKPFMIASAAGTQNYICLPSATGVSWAFLGPQATLFGERDEQVTTHFLSGNPGENYVARATWQHSRDSSAAWAVAIESSTDPAWVAGGAVPWLLLRVVGTQYGPGWGDRLVRTAFIQRVNTAGGVQPSEGCSQTADIGRRALVPYTTDYVFYR